MPSSSKEPFVCVLVTTTATDSSRRLTASYTQLRRFQVCSGFFNVAWVDSDFISRRIMKWVHGARSFPPFLQCYCTQDILQSREFSGLPLVMYHHRGNYDFICHQVNEEQSPWINNLSSCFIVKKDNQRIEGATIALKSKRSQSRTLQSSVAICGKLIPIDSLSLPSANRSMWSLPTTRKSKNVDRCIPQWFLSTASFVAFQLLLLLSLVHIKKWLW